MQGSTRRKMSTIGRQSCPLRGRRPLSQVGTSESTRRLPDTAAGASGRGLTRDAVMSPSTGVGEGQHSMVAYPTSWADCSNMGDAGSGGASARRLCVLTDVATAAGTATSAGTAAAECWAACSPGAGGAELSSLLRMRERLLLRRLVAKGVCERVHFSVNLHRPWRKN